MGKKCSVERAGESAKHGSLSPRLRVSARAPGKRVERQEGQVMTQQARNILIFLGLFAFAGCVSDSNDPSENTSAPQQPAKVDWSWVVGTWASVNPGAPSDINYWHIEDLKDSSISGYLEEYTGAKRPYLKGSATSGTASIVLNTLDTASTCNDIWKPENTLSRILCIAEDSAKATYKPRLLSWQGYYSKTTGQITGEARVSWNGGITWTDYVYQFVAQKQ